MCKLELLPNELLIVCFEYLSIFELFHSFDHLNQRFSQLIRSLSLQLNFENARKQIFDRFCAVLSSNPEIKQQIYSLHLSDKDTCGQIQRFLTDFPLDQFSRLRVLSISDLEPRNVPKLTSILPSLSQLRSVHLRRIHDDREVMEVLPMSNLQHLSILSFPSIQSRANDTVNITTLTILSCTMDGLFYHLFECFPLVKYLRIRFVSPYSYPMKLETAPRKSTGRHLTHLHIDLFKYTFGQFAAFTKQIPNVRHLFITTRNDNSMINATRWQSLIQSRLTHLKTFQFKFACDPQYLNQLSGFQSKFWWKLHHWYTEYSMEEHLACVYTVPYLSDNIKLDSHTKRFPGKIIDAFDRVHQVTLDHQIITEQSQYYFPNIHSLELLVAERNEEQTFAPVDITCLKRMVNLSHLKHLNLSRYGTMLTSTLLVELFSQAPNLSWITMNPSDMPALADDEELNSYFTEQITKVDILQQDYPSSGITVDTERFCRIFANVEHLVCFLAEPNDVFVLLHQLPKLSTLNVYLPASAASPSLTTQIEDQSRKFNYLFTVDGIERQCPRVFLWISRMFD